MPKQQALVSCHPQTHSMSPPHPPVGTGAQPIFLLLQSLAPRPLLVQLLPQHRHVALPGVWAVRSTGLINCSAFRQPRNHRVEIRPPPQPGEEEAN